MKTVVLKIRLLSYWHIGSGHGRGGDVDAVVLRDQDRLPYIPGRTIKGLLREALQVAEDNGRVMPGTVTGWFGKKTDEAPGTPDVPGKLIFDDARIDKVERDYLATNPGLMQGLFTSIAATKIDSDSGTAEDKTLRRKEVVVPVVLEAMLHGPDQADWIQDLQIALPLVRMLGINRHRGLGRCEMTLQTEVR